MGLLPRARRSLWLLALTSTSTMACSGDDTATTTDADGSSESDGDPSAGDGDGDDTTGDGDGDDTTGDGDGDDTTGDGDGDDTTGDGDGDDTTGDGDGDDTTGDGDGDDTTGDGDGDPAPTGEPMCPGPPVSYSADIQPMFDAGCATVGCHSFPAPSAGLDLSAANSHAALVGVSSGQCNDRLRVAPGEPEASYLVDKLRAANLCFGTGMPKGAPAWSAQEIERVEAWICNGALDD